MIGVVELQVLVECVGVLLAVHVLLVSLHPGVPGVPCLAVVLRHQVALTTEGAVASVHSVILSTLSVKKVLLKRRTH